MNICDDYRSYLFNKNVLIIGGADNQPFSDLSGFRTLDGEPFDVVVRINQHVYRQGGRANVCYASGDNVYRLIAEHQDSYRFNFIWFNQVYRHEHEGEAGHLEQVLKRRQIPYGRFFHLQFEGTNPADPDLEWLNIFHKRLDTKPLTGFIALHHIRLHSVRSITVLGMDLYRNKYGERPAKVGPHDIAKHIEYIREVHYTDARVIFCQEMLSAIEVIE